MIETQLADRVELIMHVASAFTSIATLMVSSQREDIRGVAILLYTGELVRAFLLSSLLNHIVRPP